MGYIYKITNLINNKIYIGQTSTTIQQRWLEHKYSSDNPNNKDWNTHLHKAIRKYKEYNFTVEVVCEAPNEQLGELEMYYIAYYDSYNSGYNMTLGGEGSRKLDYQQIYDLWDSGYGVSTIAKKVGCSKTQAKNILKDYSNYSPQESLYRGMSRTTEDVSQYDLQGNFIQRYRSASEAARITQISTSGILAACHGKTVACMGYQWRFGDERPSLNVVTNRKAVKQFTIDGQYITTFPSVTDAATCIGCSASLISRVCKNKTKQARGYLWRYENDLNEVII